MSPKRKVALVTGSSRGIGKAIALDLARQGADIIINYRSNHGEAEKVAASIKEGGGTSLVLKADVAEEQEVKTMVDEAMETFGKIDILVNNAGIHRGGRVQAVSSEDWDLVINSSLRGAFNCCRYIIPHMVGQKWGRVINISSPSGEHGYPGDTAYGSAKAGLMGFTKSLAKEVATKNITANVVIPGYLQTDMTAGLFDTDEKIKLALQGIPMRRPGEVSEVAEVVSFLAFKGSYVTGAVIRVDGGMGM